MSSPPLPTFLIIGAQKSATRWLRLHLGKHPDIFTAPRELEFFDNHFDDGIETYKEGFKGWSGQPIVGEATPGYMIWRKGCEKIAARIDETIPDVRLLAILRNPVDRAYSSFLHHMAGNWIPPEADLIATVEGKPPEQDRFSIIAGGWYAASLEPYVQRFGKRLEVLVQDRPGFGLSCVYRDALQHLGADASFRPSDLETVLFSSDSKLPKDAARLDDNGRRRPLSPQERTILYRYFEQDIQRLEKLLGIDLGCWKLEPARPVVT